MRSFNRSALSGWRPIILLLFLAGSLLVVSYRIDQEDSQRTDPRDLSLQNLPLPAARGAHEALNAVRSTTPSEAESEPLKAPSKTPAAADPTIPGPSFSIPGSVEPAKEAPIPLSSARASEQLGRSVALLSGQVLDPQGKPIRDAEVRLGKHSTRTSAHGEFSIPRGADELVVEHPEYFSRQLTAADRRELRHPGPEDFPRRDTDSILRPLRIVLFVGSRVRGHIRDKRDAPISGVSLRFSRVESGADMTTTRPGSVVRSGGDGGYESPLLHPGAYHVLMQHTSYQPQTDTITVSPESRSVVHNVVLAAGELLRLTVRATPEQPLADARVWLLSRRAGDTSEETLFLGLTDERGLLECRRAGGEGSEPVQQWVRVNLPGYREVRRSVEKAELVVDLTPAPCLKGVGVDERHGLPQTIRRLRLEMNTPGGFRRVPDQGILLHSLPKGHFRVGLPDLAGTYRVRVEAEGRLSGASDPVTFDGQTSPAEITVRLKPRGGISGVVLAHRTTVGDVVVELYRDIPAPQRLFYGLRLPSPTVPYRTTRTDTDGHFEFANIEPGTYRLRTQSKHHAPVYSAPVASPTSESIPLALETGAAIRGVVLNSESKPEPGVPLVLASLDRPFPRFTASDAMGSYHFDHLADGRYVLFPGGDAAFGSESTFSWSGSNSDLSNTQLENQVISVAAKRDVTFNLHLASFPWGSLEGVLQSDSQALANQDIRVLAILTQDGETREIRTDIRGRFRAHGLSPGHYRLQSSYPPFDEEVQIEAGKRSWIPIELTSHTIAVEVVHARTGRRVPTTVHARVTRLSSTGLSPITVTHRSRSRLGREEPLELAKLYPGPYRIEVRVAGFLPETRDIEIKGDARSGPMKVSIAVRPGIPVRITMPSGSPDGAKESTSLRGHGKVIVTRDGVEAYRFEGYLDGEVLLPELEPGIYQLAVESGGETVRSSFRILPDGAGSSPRQKQQRARPPLPVGHR